MLAQLSLTKLFRSFLSMETSMETWDMLRKPHIPRDAEGFLHLQAEKTPYITSVWHKCEEFGLFVSRKNM